MVQSVPFSRSTEGWFYLPEAKESRKFRSNFWRVIRVTTIAIFGISGVGKSRMCAILAAKLGLAHAQASNLLKRAKLEEAREAVSSEDLRKGPVLDNQTILVTSFRTFAAAESRNILFDGHSLIGSSLKGVGKSEFGGGLAIARGGSRLI